MPDDIVYVSRVWKLPLVGSDGSTVGRIDDVIFSPALVREPPRVLGFVAVVERHRIFVNANRVGEINSGGVRLRSGTIDLRRFKRRPSEILAKDLINKRFGAEVVNDIGFQPARRNDRMWDASVIALGTTGPLRRRRNIRVVPWNELPTLFHVDDAVGGEVASYREMHPSDVAAAFRRLPAERRRGLAEAMEDERLADLLEEMPEEEQLNLIENLDLDRLAHVLEEMEPDDAAELLREMDQARVSQILDAMDDEEAGQLGRLLVYQKETAGGLMTPEPVIVKPDITVAEALARVREPDLPAALSAQIFVVQPPTQTPTGIFLGSVDIRRLLREPPGMLVGRLIEDEREFVLPSATEVAVATRLAARDRLAIAVCDEEGRLLGAVTVDDILDHLLPEDWRVGTR